MRPTGFPDSSLAALRFVRPDSGGLASGAQSRFDESRDSRREGEQRTMECQVARDSMASSRSSRMKGRSNRLERVRLRRSREAAP
jgi:hypothetical protein